MKPYCGTVICLTCGLLGGCSEQQTTNHSDGNLNVELVNTLNNIAAENAIISQHTLYPYHFITAAEFNDLGQRDLAVLARHFAAHPGTLNIQGGEMCPANSIRQGSRTY